MAGYLVVIKGYDKDNKLVLNNPCSYCIGRGGTDRKVDFKVDPCEYLTSRQHFFIDYKPPRFFIRDNNSTNGTLIQRDNMLLPVHNEETELFDGDLIIAGNTVFRLDVAFEVTDDPSFTSQDVQNSSQSHPAQKDAEDQQVPDDFKFNCAQIEAATSIPSPRSDYYSVVVPEIQLFHNTDVKCITCGDFISVEITLSELQAYGFPVFICDKCASCYSNQHDLKDLKAYHILKELNEDSMGLVYLARHKESGMLASIKTIIPGLSSSIEEDMQYLKHEIEVLHSLAHPNIVRLYEYLVIANRIHLIYEYMPEGNLDDYLKNNWFGPMAWKAACRLVCDILSGLRYCHEMNIVHGQINSTNIMFKKDSHGNDVARISDFGLAQVYENTGLSMKKSDSWETKRYKAPELFDNNHQLQPQADIYSAGVVLYYLLTGTYPFAEESYRINGSKLSANTGTNDSERKLLPLLQRNPAVPFLLSDTVHKALSENPEERFQTAFEMHQAIECLYD